MPRPTSPQLQLLIERLERDARHWRRTIPQLHADTRRAGRYPTSKLTTRSGDTADPTANHALTPDTAAAHMAAVIAAIIKIEGLARLVDNTLTQLGVVIPPEPKCGGCSTPLPLGHDRSLCDACRRRNQRAGATNPPPTN